MIQSAAYLQLGGLASIVLLVVFVVIIAFLVVYFVVWALLKKPVTGVESLKGKMGVALSDFGGKDVGEVSVDGVIWKARVNGSDAGLRISKGESVKVAGVSSLTLLVQRQEE